MSRNQALDRLKNTCSKSEKCLFDIKKKLAEWKLLEAFEEISSVLIEENFINERRFASSFANDKIKFSKWGKQKVRYNLKMKGIDSKIIDNTLEEYPSEEYKEIIKAELNKKNLSIKETDKYKRLQKLYSFAAQRGYETDLVNSVLESINE